MIRQGVMTVVLTLLWCGVSAQKYPERRSIRDGNNLYKEGNFPESEVAYRRALEQNPESFEAENNLAGALYKQERYDEAAKAGNKIVKMAHTPAQAAEVYYNQGNALFKQRKLTEALEAYKNSLRLNPNDKEAKFNLAYTKKLLEQDQNKDQNDDQNKENKDNKDNQDKNQDNKDNQDQNKDNKDDPNKDKGDPDQQNPNQQQGEDQQQGGMSKEEAANMLDAMQGNEDNTKKKMDAQKVKAVGRSGKNW